MNVEDEKGKVKVWKGKNNWLHISLRLKNGFIHSGGPNNIWFSKFHFMAMIHSAMNKRFSLAQSIRTNILDMAVMKILMSKAWRILGFEWTVNSDFTFLPSKILSKR